MLMYITTKQLRIYISLLFLKVSRKELFTLKELYSFHEDLEKHLQEKLGENVKIRTGKTEKKYFCKRTETKNRSKLHKNRRECEAGGREYPEYGKRRETQNRAIFCD